MTEYMEKVNETKLALFNALMWQGDEDLYWFHKRALEFFKTLDGACEFIGDYLLGSGIVLGEDTIDFCGLLYITVLENAKSIVTHYDDQVLDALDNIDVYCNYLDTRFDCNEKQVNDFKDAMQELDMDMYDDDEVMLLKTLYENITGEEYTQDQVSSRVAINLPSKGGANHG